MKKKSTSKLLQYSALAATFLAAAPQEGASQIVYTDVDPDVGVGIGGIYNLDMDNDGNIEFEMWATSSMSTYTFGSISVIVSAKSVGIANYSVGAQVGYSISTATVGSLSSTYNVVVPNDSGDVVDASFSSWGSDAYFCFSVNAGLGGSFAVGNFGGAGDKMAAVRFEIAGNTHYGWVRVNVDADCDLITIKDYAYEATPNTPIVAGDTGTAAVVADSALALAISDIADNNSGLDLRVQFDKALDESLVSEYRIIVLKTADAAAFTLADAEAVVAANYTAVTPSGSNIDMPLTGTSTDKDGDLIKEGVPYKAFVLNMAGGTATLNSLSSVSNEETLSHVSGIGDPSQLAKLSLYGFGKEIFFQSDLAENKSGSLTVLNTLGQAVATFNVNDQSHSFQVGDLPAGTYFLKLDLGDLVLSKKVFLN